MRTKSPSATAIERKLFSRKAKTNKARRQYGGRSYSFDCFAAACAFWVIGCTNSGDQAPKNANWKVIGGLTGTIWVKFIQMTFGHTQRIAANTTTPLRFFVANNPNTPFALLRSSCRATAFRRNPSADFFRAGGWTDYPILAMWWQNRNSGLLHYTYWDCDRAGTEGAPLDALCGAGVREAYAAVTSPHASMAGRWRKPVAGPRTGMQRRLWPT